MPLLWKQDAVQAKNYGNKSKGKMKLRASIKAYGNPKDIAACCKPDMDDQKRSNITITEQEDHVVFDVQAEDATALRATVNAITKLLTVYEKAEKI